MEQKQYKLVIFDLDGTLIDSLSGIAYSVNKTIEQYGYPIHSDQAYLDFIGNGLHKTLLRALPERVPEAEIESMYIDMLDNYQQHYTYAVEKYDGIQELLVWLSQTDVRIAINSNKNHDMVEKIVDTYLTGIEFWRVYGVDANYPAKPDPYWVNRIIEETGISKAEVLFVGDTEVDIETARNAEVDVAAVSWGFRQRQVLEKQRPTYLVDQPEQLKKYFIS